MSTGRAVIATDVPGCRGTVKFLKGQSQGADYVEELKAGSNGILGPAKNVAALAAAMEFFIKHLDQIAIMGRESRRYAEERYNVYKVNAVMLREMGLNG